MKLDATYIGEILHFEGQWGQPSVCGLLVEKREEVHVVVATELFDQNPGTSVTNWCHRLAELVSDRDDLDPDKLVFIEHSPECGSKLEMYEQTFHRVVFERSGRSFSHPRWERLSRDEVDRLIG